MYMNSLNTSLLTAFKGVVQTVQHKIKAPSAQVALVALVAGLATSWSLVHGGFFRVHDYVHAARIAEMLRGLQAGQVPVRWSEHFGFGYGMPLFEFYAPLPYFVGAGLWWLGFPMELVLKLLWIFPSVAMAVAGYWLGRQLETQKSKSDLDASLVGWVVALAMVVTPYRAVNLFVRGAISEVWGLLWMPWVLLGGVWFLQGKKTGFWIVAGASAAMVLSHNLTALMVLPACGLWLGAWWLQQWYRDGRRKQALTSLVWLGLAFMLGGLLSTFYIVPALLEKSYTQIDAIFSGYFHYSQHFLYVRQFFKVAWGYGGSQWGPDDGISFFLGYGQWLGLFVAGGAMAVRFIADLFSFFKKMRPKLNFELVLGVLTLTLAGMSLWLTLQRSSVIWDSVAVMQTLQFPWRWLGGAGVWIAISIGYGLLLLNQLLGQRKMIKVALGCLVLFGMVLNAQFFRPEKYLENFNDFYYTEPGLIEKQMSSILPDYIPKAMGKLEEPPTQDFWVALGLEKFVTTVYHGSHERLYQTNFSQPTVITFAVADFPGWQVQIDGSVVTKHDGVRGGLLAVEVPSGEHTVGLQFGQTPLLLITWWISLLAGLVWIAGILQSEFSPKE